MATKKIKKIDEALEQITGLFDSGEVAEALAHATIALPEGLPCARWKGAVNKIMWWLNTSFAGKSFDARTFVQWKEEGRYPKKGSGFALFRPMFTKKKNKDGEEELVMTGFAPFTAFSFSDTEGADLEIDPVAPAVTPPLMEVAESLGVSVTYVPTELFDAWGAYEIKNETITLATPEEGTFFHELSHHVHKLVLAQKGRKIVPGQHVLQEVTAELSAAVLSKLVGRDPERLGHSYKYIKAYAKRAGMTVTEACKAVLGDVEQIITRILDEAEQISAAATTKAAA
tara:strand:- start:2049 stop:2903 length:855 start_codon:yes stop_codon:yes gene_type:complete